jgi:hypothetical protein
MTLNLTPWQVRHQNNDTLPTAQIRRQRNRMAVVAGMVGLALMGGLVQVLHASVDRGEALRSAARLQLQLYSSCAGLGSAPDRHACRHDSLQALSSVYRGSQAAAEAPVQGAASTGVVPDGLVATALR